MVEETKTINDSVIEVDGMNQENSLKIDYVGLANEESGHKVILKETQEAKGLVEMFIGSTEFASIAKELGLLTPPRPLTHDIYMSILDGLSVGFKRLEIYDLKDNAYLSRLYFSKLGKDMAIEIRPSDGIAIALRNKLPIFLNKRLLKGTLSNGDADILANLVKTVEF